MSILGVDLGGTKLALALFSLSGETLFREAVSLEGRKGSDVGNLICSKIKACLQANTNSPVQAIGISVPGIYRAKTGTVWAPNIPGWDDYPLLQEIQQLAGNIPVVIDSDRSCYVLGEIWQGNAKGSSDAIFLAVGTGIGAGIVIDNRVFRGLNGIAGAIGWLALNQPYQQKYTSCGCFEYHASGEGIAKVAREFLRKQTDYSGVLSTKRAENITAYDVFAAYEDKDSIAIEVLDQAVIFWGMAVANLVSLFNPEKIIFGGGVFGPALQFLPRIKEEALKWAQPISINQVTLEQSGLGGDAGVYGAGYLALKHIQPANYNQND